MQYFTTFFDKNYLSRGLVLIESLQKHSNAFELYLLCLDDSTFNYFEIRISQYPQVKTILLDDIEKVDSGLLASKSNRSIIEYYFTLSPCLPLYILKAYNLPHICSLDADIKFYTSPQSLFDYLIDFSIIITPHKFSKEIEYSLKYGKNNVSFQIFKNDENGLACLELWRKQCIDWCKDKLDEINDRFADQKYLDNWEILYLDKVKVLNDNVSGLAPWNLNNYKISFVNKKFYSNNERLIFYHFHHNKFINKRWITNGFNEYHVNYQKNHLRIYKNYWENIDKYSQKISNENLIRNGNISNLKNTLFEEKTVFLRINKFCSIYLDFRTLNQIIRKILFKIYA
jgi:hypothetical protein